MNKFSFIIINFIASALAVLLTTVFILIWQSSSILFNLGGLPQIIEDELWLFIPAIIAPLFIIWFFNDKIKAR